MGGPSLDWRAKAELPLCHAWQQKHRYVVLVTSRLWRGWGVSGGEGLMVYQGRRLGGIWIACLKSPACVTLVSSCPWVTWYQDSPKGRDNETLNR